VSRRTTQLATLAGALLLALAAPLPGVALAATATSPAAGLRSDVSEDASRVDSWGRARFPEFYAGVQTYDAKLVVFRRPSAAFDDELRGLELSSPTEPHDAPHSSQELEALAERVVADIGYWRDQGIEVLSVGARPNGSAVEVSSPQADRLAPLLPGRYGTVPPAVAEPVSPPPPSG